MRKLIIPRGASPRLYKELVASGEIEGKYIETDKDGLSRLRDFMDKQEKVEKEYSQVKPKRKPRKKAATGYQANEADRA